MQDFNILRSGESILARVNARDIQLTDHLNLQNACLAFQLFFNSVQKAGDAQVQTPPSKAWSRATHMPHNTMLQYTGEALQPKTNS